MSEPGTPGNYERNMAGQSPNQGTIGVMIPVSVIVKGIAAACGWIAKKIRRDS